VGGGAINHVNSGCQTRFWEDVWLGHVPLRLTYPELYNSCDDRNVLVSDCFQLGEWIVHFRRPFGPGEVSQWGSLINKPGDVRLQGGRDTSQWCLEKKGSYTTRFMYRFLAHRGLLTHICRESGNPNFP
jgi:hypothetical protein